MTFDTETEEPMNHFDRDELREKVAGAKDETEKKKIIDEAAMRAVKSDDRFEVVETYMKNGFAVEAMDYVERHPVRDYQEAPVQIMLAEYMVKNDRIDEARKIIEDQHDKFEKAGYWAEGSNLSMAEICHEQGREDLAKEYWTKVEAAVEPKLGEGGVYDRINLINSYLRANIPEKAEEWIKKTEDCLIDMYSRGANYKAMGIVLNQLIAVFSEHDMIDHVKDLRERTSPDPNEVKEKGKIWIDQQNSNYLDTIIYLDDYDKKAAAELQAKNGPTIAKEEENTTTAEA